MAHVLAHALGCKFCPLLSTLLRPFLASQHETKNTGEYWGNFPRTWPTSLLTGPARSPASASLRCEPKNAPLTGSAAPAASAASAGTTSRGVYFLVASWRWKAAERVRPSRKDGTKSNGLSRASGREDESFLGHESSQNTAGKVFISGNQFDTGNSKCPK